MNINNYVVFVVVVAVIVVEGAQPPCHIPQQFSAYYEYQETPDPLHSVPAYLYYDNAISSDKVLKLRQDYDDLVLFNFIDLEFNLGLEFYYFPQRDECTYTITGFDGELFDIPDIAKLETTLILGEQRIASYFDTYDTEWVVTQPLCTPLSVTRFYNSSAGPYAVVETFFNFVPSVPPGIFHLPAACPAEAEVGSAQKILQVPYKNNFLHFLQQK